MLIGKLTQFFHLNAPKEIGFDDDNYGIQFGPIQNLTEKVIRRGILVTVVPTIDAIDYARKRKYNFIICRFPLLDKNHFAIDERNLGKFLILNQAHISIFNIKSAWDGSINGTNESLMSKLGFEMLEVFNLKNNDVYKQIGRIGRPIQNISDSHLIIKNINRVINPERINFYMNNEEKNQFKRTLFIAGSIKSLSTIRNAFISNCSCIITGEITFECLCAAKEYEMSVISLSNYESVKYGYEKLKFILSAEFPHLEIEYFPNSEF